MDPGTIAIVVGSAISAMGALQVRENLIVSLVAQLLLPVSAAVSVVVRIILIT
jgi:hypothetical protein